MGEKVALRVGDSFGMDERRLTWERKGGTGEWTMRTEEDECCAVSKAAKPPNRGLGEEGEGAGTAR